MCTTTMVATMQVEATNRRNRISSSLEKLPSDPALQGCEARKESNKLLSQPNEDHMGIKRKRSGVRFGGCMFFESYANSEEVSFDTLWYTNEERQQFRVQQKKDAKTMAKLMKKMQNTVVARVFQVCCSNKVSPQHVEELRRFLRRDSRFIGLERFSGKEVFCDRAQRYDCLLESIKVVQQYQFDGPDKKGQVLRMTCEELSRPSILFAQCLAQAAAATESS